MEQRSLIIWRTSHTCTCLACNPCRGSLYNMLHAPGATPPAPHQRLAMWLGVARGMQHLHACRVLHRGGRGLRGHQLLQHGRRREQAVC